MSSSRRCTLPLDMAAVLFEPMVAGRLLRSGAIRAPAEARALLARRDPAALAELGKGVATGAIKYRESVAEGLAAAPEAFIGMLRGRNFGKQLVKLA